MKRRSSVAFFVFLLSLLSATYALGADKSKRLAIMPFENLNRNDKTLDWFGSAISETLINKLSRINGLTLVERTRINDALKEIKLGQSGVVDRSTAQQMGNFLGADTLVIGSFQKTPDNKMRVAARLVDVQTARVRNPAMADGTSNDLFGLQDQLAQKLLEAIKGSVADDERKKLGISPSSNVDALRALSDGVSFYRNDLFQDAITSFDKALQLDPNYVDAMYYKGLALGKLKRWDEAVESLKRTIPRVETEQRVKWTWEAPFENGLSKKMAYAAFDTAAFELQNVMSSSAVAKAQRRVVYSELNGTKTSFQIVDPVTHTANGFEMPEPIRDIGMAFSSDRVLILPALGPAALLTGKFGVYGIDPSNGSMLWHTDLPLQGLPLPQLPLIGLTDNTFFTFSNVDHKLIAKSDVSLDPKWQRENLSLETLSPALNKTRAFGSLLIAKAPAERKIHAIRISNGQDAWTIDLQTDKAYQIVTENAVVVFELGRRVFSVDPETGKTLLDLPIKPFAQSKTFTVLGTFNIVPATIVDNSLYFVSEGKEIVAADLTPNAPPERRLRWKTAPQKDIRSLLVHGSHLYANTEDGELLLADTKLGTPVVSKKLSSKPLDLDYAGDDIIVVSSDDAVMGLNPETGEKQWQYSSNVRTKPPVYFKGTVLVQTSGTTQLTALDADDGSVLWQFTGPLAGDSMLDNFGIKTLGVYLGDDSVFIVQPTRMHEYALDKKSEKAVTNKEAMTELASALLNKGDIDEAARFADIVAKQADPNYPPLHYVRSKLAEARGKQPEALAELLTYADLVGRQSKPGQDIIANLKRDHGLLWTAEVGASFANATLADGKLIGWNEHQLIALDPANGKRVWSIAADGIGDYVYDPKSRRIFFGARSRDSRTVQLYVADLEKGNRKELAKITLPNGGGRSLGLTYANDRLYVALARGDFQQTQNVSLHIFGFNATSGAQLWERTFDESAIAVGVTGQSLGLFHPKGEFLVYSFGPDLWIVRGDDGTVFAHETADSVIVGRIGHADDPFVDPDLVYFGTFAHTVGGYSLSQKRVVVNAKIPDVTPQHSARVTLVRDNTYFGLDAGSVFALDLGRDTPDADRLKWRTDANRDGFFMFIGPIQGSKNLWALGNDAFSLGVVIDPAARQIVTQHQMLWIDSGDVWNGDRRYAFTADGLAFAMQLKPKVK